MTKTPAYCVESTAPNCFTFSVLGNDSPLYINPERESDPSTIAGELNLPVPIRRRLLDQQKDAIYGETKSLQVWLGEGGGKKSKKFAEPVAVRGERVVAADLSDWSYYPRKGMVAIDPVLGRIAFPLRSPPKNGVWVSYHYGFSAEIGGGEYDRPIIQQPMVVLYRVGKGAEFASITEALKQWEHDAKLPGALCDAVIEIVDSGVYVEPINIRFTQNRQSLQLRAANRRRPIIRLLDWQTDKPDSLTVAGLQNNRFTLDGLLVGGRSMQVSGDIIQLTIRHSTLVPGWSLGCECEPQRPVEASLEVSSPKVCIKIEHSIIGSIQLYPALLDVDNSEDIPRARASTNEPDPCLDRERGARLDPLRVCISDSIVDATGRDLEAIGAPDCTVAHASLTILRTTVFGLVQVHAIALAENCLFDGRVSVARRQQGCMRFCYVTPGSRTPRRYQCQPDLVKAAIEEKLKTGGVTDELLVNSAKQQEAERVRPLFNSVRYGMPVYCQLADTEPCLTAPEARYRGAENQLYRVEIHKSGMNSEATFKWSRENAAVMFPILEPVDSSNGSSILTLEDLGRDARFGLKSNDWVEIVDDDYILQNRAENLLQIMSIDQENQKVTLKGMPMSGVGQFPEKHPYLRRWDQRTGDANGIVVQESTEQDEKWIDLEDGIQIRFPPSDGTSQYQSGDYWLIPARQITGDVEWRMEDNTTPMALLPHGVIHYYAPLAIISKSPANAQVFTDLRRILLKNWI